MKVKALLISSLPIIALSLPLPASAHDLVVRNYTSVDSTCKIHGVCSSVLRDIGISKAGDTNHVIPEKWVKLLCGNSSCQADVYMTNNCSGMLAATVMYNVNSGTQSVNRNPKSPFVVTSNTGSFEFIFR